MKEVEKLQEKREKRRLQQQELREKRAQVRSTHTHTHTHTHQDWLPSCFKCHNILIRAGCKLTFKVSTLQKEALLIFCPISGGGRQFAKL